MPWKECHVMDERLRFVARAMKSAGSAPRTGGDERDLAMSDAPINHNHLRVLAR